MSSTSPTNSILKMISLRPKKKCFRVAVLGENGVGKTALTVRFITRRYIGEYDPDLEKVYSCTKSVNGNTVDFEIMDTAVQNENNRLEENIRWADAFLLVYSVTDRCSFNECTRLRFLINSFCKKRRPLRMISDPLSKKTIRMTTPVILVGNQIDRHLDRMISFEEGIRRACEMGCLAFYEVSASEMIDRVVEIFNDLYTTYKCSKPIIFKRSESFRFGENVDKTSFSSEEEDDDDREQEPLPEQLDTSLYNKFRRLAI